MKEYYAKPGSIVIFSEGQWSDFGYIAELVTLCGIDFEIAAAEYRASFKPDDEYDEPTACGFIGWLCAQQKCAQLESRRIHLGDGFTFTFGEEKAA